MDRATARNVHRDRALLGNREARTLLRSFRGSVKSIGIKRLQKGIEMKHTKTTRKKWLLGICIVLCAVLLAGAGYYCVRLNNRIKKIDSGVTITQFDEEDRAAILEYFGIEDQACITLQRLHYCYFFRPVSEMYLTVPTDSNDRFEELLLQNYTETKLTHTLLNYGVSAGIPLSEEDFRKVYDNIASTSEIEVIAFETGDHYTYSFYCAWNNSNELTKIVRRFLDREEY